MNELFAHTGNSSYQANTILLEPSKVGDFTPFYVAIGICSVILGCIIILNIVCLCSVHSEYWCDKHTGNRWIVSIWSTTPHKQPPLDLTELKSADELVTIIHEHPGHRQVIASTSQQPLTSQTVELHKIESDI